MIGSPMQRLESATKALGVFAGISYVTGLLVTNSHLSHFGVSDFSPFKPRFVITGTLALIFPLFTTGVYIHLFQDARACFSEFQRLQGSDLSQRKALLFRAGLLIQLVRDCLFLTVPFGLALTVRTQFGLPDGSAVVAIMKMYLWTLASLACAFVSYAMSRLFRSPSTETKVSPEMTDSVRASRAITFAMFGTLSFFFFALYAVVYSNSFFPLIASQYGGGRSMQVRVLSGEPDLQNQPLKLWHESETSYVFETEDHRIIHVNKSEIHALQFQNE